MADSKLLRRCHQMQRWNEMHILMSFCELVSWFQHTPGWILLCGIALGPWLLPWLKMVGRKRCSPYGQPLANDWIEGDSEAQLVGFTKWWDHFLVINTLQSSLWDQAEPRLQRNPFLCLGSSPASSCFLPFLSSLSHKLSINKSLTQGPPPAFRESKHRHKFQEWGTSLACILISVSVSGMRSMAFIRFSKELMTQKGWKPLLKVMIRIVGAPWAQPAERLKKVFIYKKYPVEGRLIRLQSQLKSSWKVREFKEREVAWIDRDPFGREGDPSSRKDRKY